MEPDLLGPRRLAAEEAVGPLPPGGPRDPLSCLLESVWSLGDLFGQPPQVLPPPGSPSVTLLFRDASYLPRDVLDQVGPLLARAGQALPLRLWGTARHRETVELTVHPGEGGAARFRLWSVSGRCQGQLSGLGVEARLPGGEVRDYLVHMAGAVAPNMPRLGVSLRRHEELLRAGGLLLPTEGTFFSYFSWEPDTGPQQLLNALAARHKMLLWEAFLRDQLQPKEFDWLWDAYDAGREACLLEWELTLRLVLEQLGFQVCRGERSYRLADGGGRERRFDFVQGGPAERIFLKLLFPADNR